MREPVAAMRAYGLLSGVLLCGILYEGLKPFHSPANEVSWVANADAVRLGTYGTLLGERSLSAADSPGTGRTLEVWLQPGSAEDSSTIVAFYDPREPRQLSVHQEDTDLELRIASSSAWCHRKSARLNIDSAFRGGKSAFWTVTSGALGTVVYRDGVAVRESTAFRISNREFGGRLIVGNSPIFNESWPGILRGIAVYNRVLEPAQVARHFRTWTRGTKPDLVPQDLCVALYLFDEHSGRIVHNRIASGNNLSIPEKYFVLDQTTLDPVWRAFNWSWGFWKDALINTFGFIPVGCVFCAYLSANGLRRPALVSSILGGALSLFIELVQSHLPTRDSSMSDLLTNIAGSIFGAGLYLGRLGRILDQCIVWFIG